MPKKKPETFADRLRALREGAGLSQYELARRTGLSKQTLSQLEREREPSWGTARLLAKALGVSLTAFEIGEVELPELAPPAPRGRPRKAADGEGQAGKPKGRRKAEAS
jgi:transcriptional regulator with XRE-family HTH domain